MKYKLPSQRVKSTMRLLFLLVSASTIFLWLIAPSFSKEEDLLIDSIFRMEAREKDIQFNRETIMMIIKNKTLTFIGLVLTVVGIVACSPKNTTSLNETLESTKPPEARETVVFGDISNNPQKKIRRFQPLVNYLVANSSQFDRGKVKIAPDMETMIAWL